jgi:hypothetical protein
VNVPPPLPVARSSDVSKQQFGLRYVLRAEIVAQDAEDFVFFAITDVRNFRNDLKAMASQGLEFTAASDTLDNLARICENKKKPNAPRVRLTQLQIAFSRAGLNKLGVGLIGDAYFDKASMREFKDEIGSTLDWDDVFEDRMIEGVFLVAASGE